MTTNGNAVTSEDEEIAALFPQAIEFKAGDKLIASLLPMDVDHCFDFSAAIKPVIADLFSTGPTIDAAKFADLLLAAADHREGVYKALSIATGRSATYMARLPLGVLVALTQAVFQVNVDFFVRAVGSLSFITTDSATADPSAKNGSGLNA